MSKPENPYKCTCKFSAPTKNEKQPCYIWQEGFDAAIKYLKDRNLLTHGLTASHGVYMCDLDCVVCQLLKDFKAKND